MQLTFSNSAPENDSFAKDAFDLEIGSMIPLKTPEGEVQVRLDAAKVSDDGLSVELTVSGDDLKPEWFSG